MEALLTLLLSEKMGVQVANEVNRTPEVDEIRKRIYESMARNKPNSD